MFIGNFIIENVVILKWTDHSKSFKLEQYRKIYRHVNFVERFAFLPDKEQKLLLRVFYKCL